MPASVLRSVNPATGQTIGEVAVSTPEQITAAVAAAHRAQPAWRALGVAGRVAVLRALHDDMQAHREELAHLVTREMGRPISGSLKSIDGPLAAMRWNLDRAAEILAPETTFEDARERHQIFYEPFGVFGVIAPWNYPLSNFVMTALQPLLAGNTVVYKLSEEVPLFGQALDAAFARAGVPAGVFMQVYGAGDVGEKLARADIDHLHLTGSTAVGKKLYQIAAEKFIPVTLELGGSDAGIVFEDAAIDRLIEPIFWAKFVNSGQRCCSLKRLFVHQSRFDEMAQKLSAFIAKQKMGDPEQSDTALGPLASQKQKDLIAAQLADAESKGAKIICGVGSGEGAFFPPTLVSGLTSDMRAGCEELFGPVLPLIPFANEDEAIRLANDTPWGLSAFVYTQDAARYARVASRLQAGSISHNGVDYFRPFNPFGGMKQSGIGRSGGKAGLQACCQIKVVATEKA
ncbi:MAG: aldehyde dehydrogenase family protein [Alphaproteobacteria bacterium]|nr:aldehyde dehydrogenase family protein [Alphaproteobacteria bacterium]